MMGFAGANKADMMKHQRQIGWDRLEGGFMLPMGLRLFEHTPYEPEPAVIVSTVRLDGAHLESSIPGMVDAETGYETMVFFEATSFFGIYEQHYKSKRAAIAGHASVVRRLKEKTLPLAIKVNNYWVRNTDEAIAA
jgi:hypothetical protein